MSIIVLHHGELNISLDHDTTLVFRLLRPPPHTPTDIMRLRLHRREAIVLLAHPVKVCARTQHINAFYEEQQLGMLH
jgi:hypothetical protein